MRFKMWEAWICIFLLTCLLMVKVGTDQVAARSEAAQQNSSEIQFITAEELKTQIARNEPVTIIDVRGSVKSNDKIKGAVYVKVRKLKYRLGFPPLKDVPRTRLVVTYCACPNDESSVHAAQILQELGFKNVRVLKGGWVIWKKANGPVEPMARIAE